MKISKLKVILVRKKGPWQAFAVQDSAEGPVRGADILRDHRITTEQNAKDTVLYELHGSVGEVEWEVQEEKGDQIG